MTVSTETEFVLRATRAKTDTMECELINNNIWILVAYIVRFSINLHNLSDRVKEDSNVVQELKFRMEGLEESTCYT